MTEIKNQAADPFFSIIIPVYNVENYLKQCLESILLQTYSHYEIILVNDGSTDSSAEICKQYQKKYSRIHLIEKSNGGLSDARNVGLLLSSGDFVIFTDSDDFWIGDQVLSDIKDLIQISNPDIIIHEESRYFSPKDITCKYSQRFLKNGSGNFMRDALQLVYYDLFVACACDKIIRRSLLIDNELFFPLNRKSEDIEWTGRLIDYVNTYSIYDKSFYMYRKGREGSITSSVNEKHIMDVYEMVKNGINAPLKQDGNWNEVTQNFWACNYVVILKDFYILTKANRKAIWPDLVSWNYLLKSGRNIKVDKVMFWYRFLPFTGLVAFLNLYRIANAFQKKFRASRQ